MSDNFKDINETELQEILKAMDKMSRRKSPKKKSPKRSIDSTSTGYQNESAAS
jgi:anthranilate phosphoribosyltransferase